MAELPHHTRLRNAGPHGRLRSVELRVAPVGRLEECASRVGKALLAGGWRTASGAMSNVTILLAPDLNPRPVREWIWAAEQEVPPNSILLITSDRTSNLKELRRFVVGAVVTSGEIERELVRSVEQIARTSLRDNLAQAVMRCQSVEPLVREILLVSLTTVPPILSRKKLLQFLDCRSPTTVWAHWRSAPPCCGTTLGFLHKVALLHFVDLRRYGLNTNQALDAVGISRASLYQWSRRQFEVTPGLLAADPAPAWRWIQEVIATIYGQRED